MQSPQNSIAGSPPTDILPLKGNHQGHDFIIGDIHGWAVILEQALGYLKENDRLRIVGDLFDRGPDNLGVYKLVADANKNRDKPKIIITRGNHEDIFLRYYNAFVAREKASSAVTQEQLQELKSAREFCVNNGGQWLVDLFDEAKPNSPERTKLDEIVRDIQTLPTILDVEETKQSEGYAVVHANLPFAVPILNKKVLKSKLDLDPDEKHYAANARPGINPKYREIEEPEFPSKRVYCGHTVGGSVRFKRRHYNLDVGTFRSGCALMVNHHTGEVILLQGPNADPNKELRPESKGRTPLKIKAEIEMAFKVENIAKANPEFQNLLLELLKLPDIATNNFAAIILAYKIHTTEQLLVLLNHPQINKETIQNVLNACEPVKLIKILLQFIDEGIEGRVKFKNICELCDYGSLLKVALEDEDVEDVSEIFVVNLLLNLKNISKVDKEIISNIQKNLKAFVNNFLEYLPKMNVIEKQLYLKQIRSQENAFGVLLKDRPKLLAKIESAIAEDTNLALDVFLLEVRRKYNINESVKDEKELKKDSEKYFVFLQRIALEIKSMSPEFAASFAESLKIIDNYDLPLSQKMEEVRAYLVESYCTAQLDPDLFNSKYSKTIKSIIEKETGQVFPEEFKRPISTAIYHPEYQTWNFKEKCEHAWRCLNEIMPNLGVKLIEFKKKENKSKDSLEKVEQEFYRNQLDELLKIAVKCWYQSLPSFHHNPELFGSGEKVKLHQAIENLLDEYYIVVGPSMVNAQEIVKIETMQTQQKATVGHVR